MSDINHILPQFSPTALGSLGKSGLLDRLDTKFIFPEEILPDILREITSEYLILEIDGKRMMNYETVYFDTPDFYHFRQHLTRRLTRYKVRYRKYIDTDCTFFEIKAKNNHNRSQKTRVQIPCINNRIAIPERQFLEQNSPLGNEILEKKLQVNYHRFTLVNKSYPERVTVDINLSYSHNGSEKKFQRLVIAEVKQDAHVKSPFVTLMRRSRIRQFSISKYCLGIISLHDHIKHNMYKPKIRYINHVIYASQRNS